MTNNQTTKTDIFASIGSFVPATGKWICGPRMPLNEITPYLERSQAMWDRGEMPSMDRAILLRSDEDNWEIYLNRSNKPKGRAPTRSEDGRSSPLSYAIAVWLAGTYERIGRNDINVSVEDISETIQEVLDKECANAE